jgi:hypothetical protein
VQHYLKYILTLLFFILFPYGLYAQAPKKTLEAGKATGNIVIDGKLTEDAWQTADKASDFIQYSPNPGSPSRQPTDVRILYDNNAIYVGAMLHDVSRDSILKQFSPRDNYQDNTDAFGVVFDTYWDKQNGTQFIVTAAGVQADAIVKFDGSDFSWNTPWYSKVAITDSGWCVEMKIPYSALRFSDKPEQIWGVNFLRIIRRTRERSYWNDVKPNVANYVAQSGVLNGIHNIESPVRLAFLPYVSAYGENYSGDNAKTFNGGIDIKYGINESFTLDMTVVPDFGQTLFDNKVLNLSPIEVKYDERRYFFTEGVDLFKKNDLFYSRRVGGIPVNYNNVANALKANEVITGNPLTTKLYNATKVSGRNKHKLGLGVFNAISNESYATIEDTATKIERKVQTSPVSNYNVIVLDQALKNNSYLSFINTNVWRKENSYNANVSALLFKFADKTNRWGISGSTDVSVLDSPTRAYIGYRYFLSAGKISGNYTFDVRTNLISDQFSPNDLGYLDRNNIAYYAINQNYSTYKPSGIFNSTYNYVNTILYKVVNPDTFRHFSISGGHGGTLRNFLTSGVYWEVLPFPTNDYNEPRTPQRFYRYAENYMGGMFFSSDYRKKFALDGEAYYKWFAEKGRTGVYWSISPRYRFNDKFSMVYSLEELASRNDVGFVNKLHDSIFLGTRNVDTWTNTLNAAYVFTNTMSIKLAARHYWSQAKYSRYNFLDSAGSLRPTTYDRNHNINFNSFNVFLSFVWQFKPGSEMSVVYQNSIYTAGNIIQSSYFNNLNTTLQYPQSNSLSVKVIYYLDYLTLRDRFKKEG